jgi:hypothetical protein
MGLCAWVLFFCAIALVKGEEELRVSVEETALKDVVSVSLRDTASPYRGSVIWETAFISLSSSSSGGGEKCVQRLSEAEHCDLSIVEDFQSGTNKFFVTIFSEASTEEGKKTGERVEHYRQVLSIDLEHHPAPTPPADKVSSIMRQRGWKRGLLFSAASSLGAGVAIRRFLLSTRPKPSSILHTPAQQKPVPSRLRALLPALVLGLAGLAASIASRANAAFSPLLLLPRKKKGDVG